MMDKSIKGIIFAIIVCIILIGLKFTVFDEFFKTDALIPGVTDSDMFTKVEHNSTLGKYILSDSFMTDISGINIENRSEIYVTNETTGENLFDKCCNSLIGIGLEEDYTTQYSREGRFTGVFKNDTKKIIFHIFEGNDVEEYTGYYLVLIVYDKRI